MLAGTANTPVSESVYSKLFSINNEALFTINEFKKEYTNYKVFVTPYNGEMWGLNLINGTKNYVADITFTQAAKIEPNQLPFFESDPSPPVLTIPSSEVIEY